MSTPRNKGTDAAKSPGEKTKPRKLAVRDPVSGEWKRIGAEEQNQPIVEIPDTPREKKRPVVANRATESTVQAERPTVRTDPSAIVSSMNAVTSAMSTAPIVKTLAAPAISKRDASVATTSTREPPVKARDITDTSLAKLQEYRLPQVGLAPEQKQRPRKLEIRPLKAPFDGANSSKIPPRAKATVPKANLSVSNTQQATKNNDSIQVETNEELTFKKREATKIATTKSGLRNTAEATATTAITSALKKKPGKLRIAVSDPPSPEFETFARSECSSLSSLLTCSTLATHVSQPPSYTLVRTAEPSGEECNDWLKTLPNKDPGYYRKTRLLLDGAFKRRYEGLPPIKYRTLMLDEGQGGTFGFGDSFKDENDQWVVVRDYQDARQSTSKLKHILYYGREDRDIQLIGTKGCITCVGVYFEIEGSRLFCAHINALQTTNLLHPVERDSKQYNAIKNAVLTKLQKESTTFGWKPHQVIRSTIEFVCPKMKMGGYAVVEAILGVLKHNTFTSITAHGFVFALGARDTKGKLYLHRHAKSVERGTEFEDEEIPDDIEEVHYNDANGTHPWPTWTWVYRLGWLGRDIHGFYCLPNSTKRVTGADLIKLNS